MQPNAPVVRLVIFCFVLCCVVFWVLWFVYFVFCCVLCYFCVWSFLVLCVLWFVEFCMSCCIFVLLCYVVFWLWQIASNRRKLSLAIFGYLVYLTVYLDISGHPGLLLAIKKYFWSENLFGHYKFWVRKIFWVQKKF